MISKLLTNPFLSIIVLIPFSMFGGVILAQSRVSVTVTELRSGVVLPEGLYVNQP